MYTDEGLTCLAELIYNQKEMSPRIWNFFQMIVNSILVDEGIHDEFLQQVFAVFINLINKAPEQFKSITFNMNNTQITALDLTCQLIVKCIEVARIKEDEIDAISVMSLSFALLENLQGVSHIIPGMMEIYLKELGMADTPDYTIMLLQGVHMCLWYDLGSTLSILEQSGTTEMFFGAVFEKISTI